MSGELIIDGVRIDDTSDAWVIAEIGNNHQGIVEKCKEMFRAELIYALRILQDGVRTRETMNASLAGAMGLTQFMPSEYYTLAYDLDGDGRKDIWGSVPDALASAANQLKGRGWVPGQTWGYEVALPAGQSRLAIPLPDDLAGRNVLVEVTAAGKSRALPYYAAAMDVRVTESYGQVRAADATGKPKRRR